MNDTTPRLSGNGRVSGYACLFERPDLGRDVIGRGAFLRSLGTRPAAQVRMLFQHDPARPIGTWDVVREDKRGLFVSGRLALGAASAADVAALVEAEALDGLSIGFRTLRAVRGRGGLRRLLDIDLHEISLVTFPMQPQARLLPPKE